MNTKTELKEEFKKLSLQIEHFDEQLKHTFNLEEKEQIKKNLQFVKSQIDLILDQYNLKNKFNAALEK